MALVIICDNCGNQRELVNAAIPTGWTGHLGAPGALVGEHRCNECNEAGEKGKAEAIIARADFYRDAGVSS